MSHLTPGELVDAVEDTLTSSRLSHVSSCAVCRTELAQLRAVLSEADSVDIPEPSPLFWERFSDRVRVAITVEPPGAPSRWPEWLQWPVIVPLAGLALLVLALVSAVASGPIGGDVPSVAASRSGTTVASNAATMSETELEMTSDAGWAVVSELVGPLDFDTAQEAGIMTAPGAADAAASRLSAAEQHELVRLLRQELGAAGS